MMEVSKFNNKIDILIVDDEILNIYSLKELMKTIAKCKCDTASNGFEAVNKIMSK